MTSPAPARWRRDKISRTRVLIARVPLSRACKRRSRWCDRSIHDGRHPAQSRGAPTPLGCLELLSRKPSWPAASPPRKQAGHMDATTWRKEICSPTLAGRGPFSNRLSAVNRFLLVDVAFRVTVLSAVSVRRRNLWSEAQALQCPQRAYVRSTQPNGLPRSRPAPSPRSATHIRAALARMLFSAADSDAHGLLGPAEGFARTPDAVQDHGQLPGKGHARLAWAGSLRDGLCPVL